MTGHRNRRLTVIVLLTLTLPLIVGAACARTQPLAPVVSGPALAPRVALPRTPDGVARLALESLARGDDAIVASLVATGVDTASFAVPSADQTVTATLVHPFTRGSNVDPLRRHPELAARGVTRDSILGVVVAGWDSGTPGVGVNFFLVAQQKPGAVWLIVWRGSTPP